MPEQEDFAPIVARGCARAAARRLFRQRTFEITRADPRRRRAVRVDPDRHLDAARAQRAAGRAAKRRRERCSRCSDLSMLVAMLLAQWMLRPIHVIQSGLTPAWRGELDVRAGPAGRGVQGPWQLVRRRQRAARGVGRASSSEPGDPHTVRPGGSADFESVMENLEDAVALFSPRGNLIFCNAAMQRSGHPELPADTSGAAARRADAGRRARPQGPVSAGARSTGQRRRQARSACS